MLSDRCISLCLSCLSVTFVHCGQTVGRIKMKLGIQSGLGPGHVVLDGDLAPPPPKGGWGRRPRIFGPYLLRPIGCRDRDPTWYGARTQPRRLCVRRGRHFPPPQGGGTPQIFDQCLLWPNGWMHQDATWYGCRPQPRGLCVRWRPSPPSQKGGRAPKFSAHACDQTAGWIKMPLARR